jgi:hypothetical protein
MFGQHALDPDFGGDVGTSNALARGSAEDPCVAPTADREAEALAFSEPTG